MHLFSNRRVYYTLMVEAIFECWLRYIHTCIYLVVNGPEIIGGFGLEEKSKKTKAVYCLGRTNYGGFGNVETPIIDTLD